MKEIYRKSNGLAEIQCKFCPDRVFLAFGCGVRGEGRYPNSTSRRSNINVPLWFWLSFIAVCKYYTRMALRHRRLCQPETGVETAPLHTRISTWCTLDCTLHCIKSLVSSPYHLVPLFAFLPCSNGEVQVSTSA